MGLESLRAHLQAQLTLCVLGSGPSGCIAQAQGETYSCDIAGVIVICVDRLRVAGSNVKKSDVGVAAGSQVHLVCADLNLVDLHVSM